MATISYKTTSFFPEGLALSGIIIAGFSIILAFVDYSIGVPILLLGVVVATTHYRFTVDITKKVYSEYIWFLGLRLGKTRLNYEAIEYVFIKSSKESQTMNSRVVSNTITKVVFDGYLKFSEDNKVHIATRSSRGNRRLKLTQEKIADAGRAALRCGAPSWSAGRERLVRQDFQANPGHRRRPGIVRHMEDVVLGLIAPGQDRTVVEHGHVGEIRFGLDRSQRGPRDGLRLDFLQPRSVLLFEMPNMILEFFGQEIDRADQILSGRGVSMDGPVFGGR